MFVDNRLSTTSLVEGHVSFHTMDKSGLELVLLYVGKAALAAGKIKWPVNPPWPGQTAEPCVCTNVGI